jgi:hypothetical protein
VTTTRSTQADLDDLRIKHARLSVAYADMLSRFIEKGHPGYEAVRTHWVQVATVVGWRKTYEEATS